MDIRFEVEKRVLAAAMALPEAAQRRLGGRPVRLDGQTLAADTQLMLRLQRVSRQPDVGRLPIPQGRALAVRQTRLAGGEQPVGSVRDLRVAGLGARLYVPSGAAPTGPLLVFLHGGGFFFGDLDTHDAPCRLLAERSGVRVLAVDYRLAPEHPFPAAYDDAQAAYRWVLEHAADLGTTPDRVAVGGDSAGGNLAAGVAIEAARDGLPVAFQLLVYPVTDNDRATLSSRLFADGFYLSTPFRELASRSYLPGGEVHDPRASPAYAELPAGLAPALVVTAGFDPLRDEGEAYARLLEEAGATVELRRFEDQIHGFFNIVGVGRSALAANHWVADRLRAALNP
ncbi:alpha/beta hydrolase [Nocardioides lianchengensis]|uniref:Acetyl esterase n=1 Tax=Nocardioides lianchengensis TaxID=1045774 RepID=A0A1G6XR68_9ACTN|nr:alpha/beta hydrolase [Nocardioides lianchengensis]NYG13402.1 acetyl esterase [Nocardioides lianchengensis]SDD80668.1 acetyl esterase [Nocardioides lianchengensis]